MRTVSRVLRWAGSSLLIVLLVQCARFNAFYNAQTYFHQAEKARLRSQKTELSSAEIELYDQAIKKASKVLTFYPKSKLVDDALLLMGKAFYYKGEYPKALRKFSELITNFPQSDLISEAAFWLGKCYYANGDYEQAEISLSNIVTQKKAKKWAAEAQFLLAEMAFQKERHAYAIEEYGKVVVRFPKSPRSAEAQYRIGQCLTLLGRPHEARTAYDRVFSFSPHDTLKLNATFSIGQSLREEGRYDQAIGVFEKLLKDSRNMEYYSAIRLEIAECEAERGDLETAIAEYEEIIEDYPKTESSAEAHYRLGSIYLNVLSDLPKAKEHLDQIRGDYGKSPHADEAQRISANIDGVTKLYQQLAPPAPDSSASESGAQSIGDMIGEKTIEDALGELVDSILAEEDGSDAAGSTAVPSTNGPLSPGLPKLEEPAKPAGTAVDTAQIQFKLAEFYLLQFSRADSALAHYRIIVDRFPESNYGANSAFAIAWIKDMILNDTRAAQEAYVRVIEMFPGTSYDKAARMALGQGSTLSQDFSLARSQFEEAENMFLRGGDVDSIVTAYQKVVDAFPDTPYAPKAGYAIAWIREYIEMNPMAAEEAYQTVLSAYGDTEYGSQSKVKVGVSQRAKEERTAPQPESKKETRTQSAEDSINLQDIEREMLEEGPIIFTEPATSNLNQ